jgi:hypothetical protein
MEQRIEQTPEEPSGVSKKPSASVFKAYAQNYVVPKRRTFFQKYRKFQTTKQ